MFLRKCWSSSSDIICKCPLQQTVKENLLGNGPGRVSTLKIVTFVLIENDSYPIKISEVVFCGYSITLLSKGKINFCLESRCSLPEPLQGGQEEPMDVCQHALNNFGTSTKGSEDPRGNRKGLVNMPAIKGNASIKRQLHLFYIADLSVPQTV